MSVFYMEVDSANNNNVAIIADLQIQLLNYLGLLQAALSLQQVTQGWPLPQISQLLPSPLPTSALCQALRSSRMSNCRFVWSV